MNRLRVFMCNVLVNEKYGHIADAVYCIAMYTSTRAQNLLYKAAYKSGPDQSS